VKKIVLVFTEFSVAIITFKEVYKMKRNSICIVIFAVILFFFCNIADAMTSIQNITSRPVLIRMNSGSTINLAPGQTAGISDSDALSSNIKKLIQNGTIVIISKDQQKTESGKTGTGSNDPSQKKMKK
jgi:hypothetical protein